MLEKYNIIIIKLSGLMINNMEEVLNLGQMEQNMRENINLVKKMETVNLILLMALYIRVNIILRKGSFSKMKFRVKEHIHGQMEEFM